VSDLWTLQLMFCGAQARTVTLVYQGEAEARAVMQRIAGSPVMAEFPFVQECDHYGTEVVVFSGGPLEALQLQEGGRAGEGAIELALQQARIQARAQERGAKDPVLVAAKQRQTLVQTVPGIPAFMPAGKM